MPSRKDFLPEEMVPFLSCVCLMDVKADPLDFRYRLIGTELVRHLYRDYTGIWMSTLPHQRENSTIFQNLRRTMEEKKPIFYASPYVGPHKGIVNMHDMSAPLSENGCDVDMIFVVVDFAKK